MNPVQIERFAEVLRRHRAHFVVVGGAAVFQEYPSESRDVDALLMTKEYARVVEEVDHDPAVVSMTREAGQMAGGHFVVDQSLVRFDLLDPQPFAGRRPADDFFDYVARFGSRERNGLRFARTATVWYMRLVLPGEAWRVQVPKVLRDVRAGAPWSLLTTVGRIGRRFGVHDRLLPRLRVLREQAQRVGLRHYG